MSLFYLLILPIISLIRLSFKARNNLSVFNCTSLNCACFIFFANWCIYVFHGSSDQLYLSWRFEGSYSDLQFLLYTNLWSHVDSISLFFVLLSNLLIIICIILSARSIDYSPKEFHFALHLTNLLLIGVFCCSDILMFFIFFEAILIPIFMVIALYGSREERKKAAFYFFFYTLFGSVYMLVALVKVYCQVGTLSIQFVSYLSLEQQIWLFMAFSFSFAVKVPMFPVHIWLPQAHVEAPVAGSILLAGILLKLGGYGFYRFGLPFMPEGSWFVGPVILIMSVIGIVYACVLTMRQVDLKRLIAYSSVSHMSFITLALLSNTIEGDHSAIYSMMGHGFVASGYFAVAGMIYERFHSRIIRVYKGLVSSMPITALFFLILVLGNISTPGYLNFWGEFFAFNSSVYSKVGFLGTFLILLSIISGAIYSFNLFNSLFLGKISKGLVGPRDLAKKEKFSMIIFTFITISIGILTHSTCLQVVWCTQGTLPLGY